MFIWVLCSIFAAIAFWFFTDVFNYWRRRGVPQPKVSWIFGNIGDSILMKRNVGLIYSDIYKSFTGERYVGIYNLRVPSLLVRDPEIVKDVMIKDFSSFHDNDFPLELNDDILSKNPFFLRGDQWKVTRTQLTPCFSSGKVKSVFPLIENTCKKFVEFIEKEQTSLSEEPLDVKELCCKYTTENIATCAFGLEGKCFEDPKAEFREIGREMLTPTVSFAIKSTILMFVPSLSKITSLRFIPENISKRLTSIVLDTLQYRKENNIVRNDFLDILNTLKSKSTNEYPYTDEDTISHSAGFFIDGFETSSVALSFALFNLGCNLDVQKKLREEVNEVFEKTKGKLTYEIVQEMSYLESVLNESLRMHSPVLFFKKTCSKRYVLKNPKTDEKDLVIEPNTPVVIPVLGLHSDPQYFPEPERFNPERFSNDNKQNIVKGTFMPFGDGPRVCIGQRFALLQVKMGIIHVIRNFEVRVNSKTKTPIELDPLYFLMAAKGGLWLNFKKIKAA